MQPQLSPAQPETVPAGKARAVDRAGCSAAATGRGSRQRWQSQPQPPPAQHDAETTAPAVPAVPAVSGVEGNAEAAAEAKGTTAP